MNEKMIQIEEGFQTSINIAYDLKDDAKIKKFIPTLSSIDVIEDIMLSVNPSSTQRARMLVGAYGRGKSHIILVLLALLSRKDKKLFKYLLERIKAYNVSLYDYIISYVESERKILPVVISGSSASLTQSFLNALQQTLVRENLTDVMPETHFAAAINTIQTWRSSYIDTYNTFIKLINEPIVDFIMKLKSYDVASYDKFVSLYPTLTAGSSFNPFLGFDVVEIYEKVNEKLQEKGYEGIFVVYDEFSKYLESSISSASISDIKLLQDFAEKCNRSSRKQLHLLLICHKDISNYIDSNLPKDKVDGWRGVSGRFKHIDLQNNFSQIYEIITSVIIKNNSSWKDFYASYGEYFGELSNRFSKNAFLGTSSSHETQKVIIGCYPLHPISVFVLPRLSEKVAQNERTLFTFLSANEKHTLSDFLSNHNQEEVGFLTVDSIYDYFEPLLRKEPYTSETHKIYQLTASVLRKVAEDSLEAKIIKFLSLVYIVAQFEKLPPTADMVVEAFKDSVEDSKDIQIALDKLLQKDCIVYLKRSNNYLKIKESSGVDIPDEIIKAKSKLVTSISAEKILNDGCLDNYLYPTKYNDKNDVIRYFDFAFISASKLLSNFSLDNAIDTSNADGIVFAVICKNSEEISSVRQYISNLAKEYNRIVFIVPQSPNSIDDLAYEYAAVKILKEAAVSDEVLSDEYSMYVEDLSEVISDFVDSYIRPELHKSEYYYLGKPVYLTRKAHLSGLLSSICEQVFIHTPLINNESINKNFLPTVAINSRGKILNGILSVPVEKNLGLVGFGQDVSIMRSTLIRTGLISDIESTPIFNRTTADANMNYLLETIRGFFKDAALQGTLSFSVLYDRLTSPRFGIGLKKGVIPIYLAVIVREVRDSITILTGKKEIKLSGDLLSSINEAPHRYFVRVDEWNSEKEDYIAGLIDIFSDFIIEKNYSTTDFSVITNAMNRWYLSLPKYTKEQAEVYCGISDRPFKPISKSRRLFINSLKNIEINPRQFLFEDVFSIFGRKDFSLDVLDNIRGVKNEYDSSLEELIYNIAKDIKVIFGANSNNISMASVLKDWCESLYSGTFSHLFAGNENKVLELLRNATNDEKQMVQRIAKLITSLRIEDWSSKTIIEFVRLLKKFKSDVETYSSQASQKNAVLSDSYNISFVSTDGSVSMKSFERVDYSRKAILLKNEIETALEEMGQAISEQEKRQVLIELLEKLC